MGIQCGHKLRFRKYFKNKQEVMNIPNLIEIQKKSYDDFLQKHTVPDKRKNFGLQGVFQSVFPITSYNNSSSIEFVNYSLGEPKYDLEECRQKELTYGVSVKVLVRLISWDVSSEKEPKAIKDIKEQEVYFGEIPLMTDTGTFVINGKERVVVSQLHRSPGVFFDHDKGKTLSSGKFLYSARIIPNRGSWIDLEMDTKDIIHVRIDRRRKFPATVLLKALGYTQQDLLRMFYEFEDVYFENGAIRKTIRSEFFSDEIAIENIVDPVKGSVIVKKGRKINKEMVKRIRAANIETVATNESDLEGKIFAEDVIDPDTEEVLFKANEVIDSKVFPVLYERKIKSIKILFIDNHNVCASISNTLSIDKVEKTDDAVSEIYKRLRPNDPPSQESANQFFERLFFNSEHYDLSTVGRLKLNESLGRDVPLDNHTLDNQDIVETVRRILQIKNGHGNVDDIDHLGNRRVRTVGELVENHFRIGLVRMERAIREKMSLQDTESLMPNDMINSKLVSAVIKEFFGSSQLSQFMDQTNPLSEITHKRRLSALGPGGLTRERAGFEVRDVHPTHYGRICPIETPEGPNIGLIASLSTFAKVNEFGFVETPYRKVVNGRVTDDVQFLTALQEEKYYIAQANASIDEKGRFVDNLVSARKDAEFVMAEPQDIEFMDVSPKQLVSVAASLIPFLEHDDANRALMGSNMQRQGVPLLNAEAPLVGTGMESVVARDSGVAVVAKRNGVVRYVDAERIVIKNDDDENGSVGADIDIYKLIKYRRSNQNTCINQRPIVKVGDSVEEGDIIADGPATEMGELAMGRNVLVAFMPWGGYNFEDSILVSERLVKEDVFTSVHIEEFQVVARDTKLGKEEITRDIPNVGDEMLRNLDESGIVRIGAEVKTDDILVGKITPKGETQLSPEEKLLRAIFGEKARDVQATPLKVPSGIEGTVINVNVFSRKGADKDERTRYIEDEERAKILKDQEEAIRLLKESVSKKLNKILCGKTVAKKFTSEKKGKVLLNKNHIITEDDIEKISLQSWLSIKVVEDPEISDQIETLKKQYDEQITLINSVFEAKTEKIKKGDELPPGVIKMVKVSLAVKRKLSVGDKMAGRHGNKGVLSRILPVEDMPYLEDGTHVDIVLNPLGVPSRMNVGQILETHLGWTALGLGKKIEEMLMSMDAPKKIKNYINNIYKNQDIKRLIDDLDDDQVLELAKKLSKGIHVASPVFDGVPEKDIEEGLLEAGLPSTGQTVLFDGRTGEPFNRDVTVGIIYIMKLHHLVDDKIHARSIGSYSLVTQQPLGGKAQFGGQRLGEMEVWALEAYGAAHTLQELLTLKSDDVYGRTKLYENIVKGEIDLVPSIPESFNVLVKELQSLCLDVQFLEGEQPQ